MATCKNCIGNDYCFVKPLHPRMMEKSCKNFKNKADYVEVKHGEWIAHYNGSFKPIYRCSVCNERLVGYSEPNKVPYCHCGAKMDIHDNGRKEQ